MGIEVGRPGLTPAAAWVRARGPPFAAPGEPGRVEGLVGGSGFKGTTGAEAGLVATLVEEEEEAAAAGVDLPVPDTDSVEADAASVDSDPFVEAFDFPPFTAGGGVSSSTMVSETPGKISLPVRPAVASVPATEDVASSPGKVLVGEVGDVGEEASAAAGDGSAAAAAAGAGAATAEVLAGAAPPLPRLERGASSSLEEEEDEEEESRRLERPAK